MLGRATYGPGWRWSTYAGPTAGTALCHVERVGLVLSGQAMALMADGTEQLMTAGTSTCHLGMTAGWWATSRRCCFTSSGARATRRARSEHSPGVLSGLVSGRVEAVLLLACVALGGCASEAEESLLALPDTPSSTAGPGSDGRSNTPRITLGPAREDAEILLLSEDDVGVVDGFRGAVAADIGDLELYENPDPRGPCGAPVVAQPTPDAGRGFTTEDAIVLQFVYLDAGMIEVLLEALAADLRPGCEPHESRTNVGTVQRVSAPLPIDTTGLGTAPSGGRQPSPAKV
jgi:hypothetical protein